MGNTKETVQVTPDPQVLTLLKATVSREHRERLQKRAWRVFVTVGAICGVIDLALRIAQLAR